MDILFLRNKKSVWIILGVLVCLNFFAWIAVYNLSQPQPLEVVFFDVGQGDSILIEAPKGRQILIDGGPSSVVLEKLAKEMSFYDRTIDLIILTHPERDHLYGLLEVLKRYKVDNILWTGVVRDTPEYKEWLDLIKRENANIITAKAGEKIIISDEPLIYIDILNPQIDLSGKDFKNSNDTSVVARLVFNKDSFLFAGDISQKAESDLVRKGINLNSEVLKVAHHGSKYSTSPDFLEKVSPKIAVIEVGKNNTYGHPTPEVLAKLKDFGIEVLRTDINGDVKMNSEGNNIKVYKNN